MMKLITGRPLRTRLSIFSSNRFSRPKARCPNIVFNAILPRHLSTIDVSNRGPIPNGELFSYTSGRYLYNEKTRLAERYIEFNIEAIKKITAESVGRKSVKSITKLAEGGFNRVLLLIMDDGFEVIVKIPYTISVPKQFATESEVATLDFLRSKGMPVPKVYAWSSKAENEVGAEYIIMEKAVGNPLEERWFSLAAKEQAHLVTSYAEIEQRLFSFPFAAYGSLYYRSSLPAHLQTSLYAPDTQDNDGDARRFCIGPIADYMFWRGKRADLDLDRGPWRDPQGFVHSIAWKEKEWTSKFGKPQLNEFPHNNMLKGEVSPAIYVDLLDKYLSISPYLLPKDREHLANKPLMRHPDLNPTNIYVSDNCKISCIIDWQHTTILPQLLAAGNPPVFENPDSEPPKDYTKPALPDNYKDLTPEEKSHADELHRRRMLFYWYMIFNAKDNKSHLKTLQYPMIMLIQHLVERSGRPWTGNIVTLKGALLQIINSWEALMVAGSHDPKTPCPVHFDAKDEHEFYPIEENWFKASILLEHLRSLLGDVGQDGWVRNESFQHTVDTNKELKREWIAEAEDDYDFKSIEQGWPFQDHEEEESA